MNPAKLRLAPIPSREVFRMTIAVPAALRADLLRYAELLAQSGGKAPTIEELIPHMLESFMSTDRAFRRTKRPM
jgi:hypothetical protein